MGCRVPSGLYRFLERPVVGTPGAGNWALLPAFPRPVFSAVNGGQVAGSFPAVQATMLYGFAPQPTTFEGLQYDAQEAAPLVNDQNEFASIQG